MKKSAIIILAAIFVLGSAFTVLMNWKADAEQSTVSWNIGGKKGTFGNLIAAIDFDKTKPGASKVVATVDVKSLKTGNESLTNHLLSAEFFEAEKFPKITFTSKEITVKGEAFIAKGNLQIKDTIKAIEFPFTFKQENETKAVFDGTMTVNAREFGLLQGRVGKTDTVQIYLMVPVTK